MALSNKPNSSDNAARARCPSCGANLGEEAVICLQCGYDTRTGRRVNDEAAPRRNPLVLAGVALLVAAAAVLLIIRLMGSGDSPAPTPAPPLAEPAVTTHAPAAAESPAVVEATSAPESAPAPTDTTPPAAPEAAVETEIAPAEEVPPPDRGQLEAAERPRVKAQLDKVAPLFEAGDMVELRLTNGVVQRGVFVARENAGVSLNIGTNQTRAVPFAALDRASRVRCDPEFRLRYIEFHTRQRAQKLLNGPDSTGSD